MKIVTEHGQLDLPSDFSMTIEQNSPIFSHEGTQSIPTTFPASEKNLAALGNPTRLGRVDRYLRKADAKIMSGVVHKSGQLVIESVGSDSGIVGAVMLNESDLYSKIKDMTLPAIFATIVRDDFANASNPVSAWYSHIYDCMKGTISDDFTAFPVAADFNDTTGYFVINMPDYTSALDPWSLKWDARNISSGEESLTYPAGYGISPFLWLWRTIELLFLHFGYTVDENILKDDALLKKIVLINNTADSICKGKLVYSDLVPDCSVSEFITFLENKFMTQVYIYPESKTVDLIPLDSVLSKTPDIDLTPVVDGFPKYTFTDVKEIKISSKTDLPGANPAAETIFDLGKIYDEVTEISEADWRNYNWGDIPIYTTALVLRKSTGQFYTVYFRRVGGPTTINRIGSNYFSFCENQIGNIQEYQSADIMPPIVEVVLGIVAEKEAVIFCPSIGASSRRNIKLTTESSESSSNSKQDIIIAYAAGKADDTAYPAGVVRPATISPKYFLGTTQKRDNAGNIWADSDLTTTDLYRKFFKNWNDVLRSSNVEVECKVNYKIKDFMSLRMDVPKLLYGQKVLLKSVSFTVSDSIKHIMSKFLLVKKQFPIVPGKEIPFGQ